jgi:hypothetical protein
LTWGVGNFAANLGGDSCVSVPEPGPGSLIALGLLTLGFGQFVRSRRYQAGSV